MSTGNKGVTKRAWLWLVVASLVAPAAYALIQGYLALLLVPALQAFSIHSQSGKEATFLLFSVVGAALAAVLLSFLFTLLAKQGSALLGFLLGVATVIALLALQSSSVGISAARAAAEYAVFVLVCAGVSHMVGRKHVHASA
ncbi:hypothetical protein [Piscinibacter sp. HJYY11]|uniref:hypothetical protein n=1 Tax=Piscinibacter sp. HJYY11 TaxID=2801333 RepID=UPI00191F8153|nr:hypothetical protein [Piscinibacter sp. HJYY11]MBL0731213.1 hypothetical protein [Piscinibacter sp. HJYY11]